MAEFINYFWQSFFCLCFFFGIYWVFLRDEKSFRFNRAYLLITPALALLFPMMEIPVSFDKPSISLEHTDLLRALKEQADVETIGTFGLPEFTVTDTKLPLLWEIKDYLLFTYLSIVVLLSFKLFWQYLQLRQMQEKGWYQTVFKLKGDYFLIPTFGLAPVFSFFNRLFWDDTQVLTPEEESHIIQHELEHIHQKHTWDVLYYQALSILFWFNPVIHLMRLSLVDLHEYLADEKVLGKIENKSSYPKLIVKMAFKGLDLPIGNYFIRSTTLKRIMMMKKSAKINWFKLAMVLPLTGMLFGLVSMKTERGLVLFTNYETANIRTIKQQMLDFQDSLNVGIKVRSLKNPVHYEKINPLENGILKSQLGELEYEFSGIKSDADYLKVRELIQILRANSQMKKTYENAMKPMEVQNIPKPVDGWKAWEDFLRSKVTVPEKEEALGLAGVVELEFIVDQEGKIQHPVIRRSFGGGLDDQLIAALKGSEVPAWENGTADQKPVAVVMTYPVGFDFRKDDQPQTAFFPQPSSVLRSQNYPRGGSNDTEIFDVVESMPVPPGGMEGWNAYLKENLKYTQTGKDQKVEGTVYVVFVVDKEGNLQNPEILRGIGAGLDEEAIRVVKESPTWKPGMQHGQLMNVKMRLPIRFRLPEKPVGQDDRVEELKAENADWKNGAIQPGEVFNKYLQRNFNFPKESRNQGTTGTVLSRLSFDSNGKINNVTVIKGLDDDINEEVIKQMKSAPNWEVKEPKGSFEAIFPVTFKLNNQPVDGPDFHSVLGKGLVVHGYGPQSKFQEPSAKNNNIITIKLINDQLVNFNGLILPVNPKLSDAIQATLDETGLNPTDITAHLSAEPDVKMGVIQEVQAALRTNRINKLLYTSSRLNDGRPKNNGSFTPLENQPLVVLDGVVNASLDDIDPKNIESISVIKDGKAINLYGSAAKNGVILVTSKK
ncbi:TonB family protein [Lunatibacter salilacus]|uniref:TonB family protein n=1 Tax=Lunatibacter salilacus TaxID=2483804 RepID=UPI00131E023A|nr:TonB family protein [Lunatibacter salilacus]